MVSLFFSVNSIASLAESLLTWQGFIVDGVQLYRKLITYPFVLLGERVGLDYSASDVDLIVLLLLFVFLPILRLARQAHGTWLSADSVIFSAPIVFIAILYGVLGSSEPEHHEGLLVNWAGLAIGAILVCFVAAIAWVTFRLRPILAKVLVGQFLVSVVFVFALGVILTALNGIIRP